MTDERVHMVMGEDENGDIHLFASDDRERADAKLREWENRFTDVRANWQEQDRA
jgi:hypothetical protein